MMTPFKPKSKWEVFLIMIKLIPDHLIKKISDLWSHYFWKNQLGKVKFPYIRRVVAQTIEQDLVAIQPLSAPVGNLHYLDYSARAKEINLKDYIWQGFDMKRKTYGRR